MRFLKIFPILGSIDIVMSLQPNEVKSSPTRCQERSTKGQTYVREANTTLKGVPCQMWSDTQPHDYPFASVGEHNFCRNPIGGSGSRVWCTVSQVRFQPMSDGKRHFIAESLLCNTYKLILIGPGILHRALFEK